MTSGLHRRGKAEKGGCREKHGGREPERTAVVGEAGNGEDKERRIKKALGSFT